MATQEADKPQRKKRTSIFSGKLRVITIILSLIFAGAGLIFWINGINNDNTHIDKIMGAVFVVLTFVCAFLTIPFQDSKASTFPQTSSPPNINDLNNKKQSIAQQQPPVTAISTPNPASSNSQAQQQPSPPGMPIQNQTLSAASLSPSIDRADLLDHLRVCPEGIFKTIVDYLEPPPGALSSDRVSVPERAGELLRWAENPPGPGLEAVYQNYLRAMGIGKKPSVQW